MHSQYAKLKQFFSRHEALFRRAVVKLVEKVELLRQITDVKNGEHRSRTTENVAPSFEESPSLPIPRRSLESDIPQKTLPRILPKDLSLKAFKVQLAQKLKPVSTLSNFADWVL